MKPLALIVDDNPGILDVLQERVESMGHDCHAVGCQIEANERLSSNAYAYVLLDLELPVRSGRLPSQNVGKNLLAQIKDDTRNRTAPVLVVTAHGKDSPTLAVELMKMGADDFINKPFDDLEKRIKEALQKKQHHAKDSGAASTMTLLTTAELGFSDEGAEINGIQVCQSSSRVYRILKLLAARRGTKRSSLSCKALADELDEARGEAAVTEAISSFRKHSAKRLAEHNVHATEDAIIATTPSGYCLAPGIHVSAPPVSAALSEPAPSTRDQRREWLLAALRSGKRIRRQDYQDHFKVSEPTAKRDLAGLKGKVKFAGVGVAGYYCLAN